MNKISIILVVTFFAALIYISYSNFSTGRDSEDFEITCIQNQTVMVSEFGSKMSAYNALTPNGKPIACQGNYKSESSWNPFSIDGDDWETKCFSGQRVFQANFMAKQATVIALAPKGTPKTCTK
jgi:hypothetical protein